jgi:hypothetical protein
MRRTRAAASLPDRSDLPPEIAAIARIFDRAGRNVTVEPSDGGRVWTILGPDGIPLVSFDLPGQTDDGPPTHRDDMCMDLGALWRDPEYRRQRESGLVDVYGRPTHPEGRDFFSEAHRGHDHEH